jgi:hypothetical protein
MLMIIKPIINPNTIVVVIVFTRCLYYLDDLQNQLSNNEVIFF